MLLMVHVNVLVLCVSVNGETACMAVICLLQCSSSTLPSIYADNLGKSIYLDTGKCLMSVNVTERSVNTTVGVVMHERAGVGRIRYNNIRTEDTLMNEVSWR